MKKPTIKKSIVTAVIGLILAIAGAYGLNLGNSVKDSITDVTCDVAVECTE